MQKAERAGKSPFDFAPDTPAVLAIENVARRFVEGEAVATNGAARTAGNGRP